MVNGENNLENKNKFNWKKVSIWIIVAVIIIVGVILLSIYITKQTKLTYYNNLIYDYFVAVSKGDNSTLTNYVAKDFINELGFLDLKKSKFKLYSYAYQDDDKATNIVYFGHILFAININNNSYLCKAYLTNEDNKIKIGKIEKVYVGFEIKK